VTAGALIDLCLATGNLGPGSGPFSLTGQSNSMGTRVCSSKSTWPGYRSFEDPNERRVVADAWGVPVDRLPDDSGLGPVDIIEAIDDEVETIWTVATNPVAGMPDSTTVYERLDDVFLVVQDAFYTETVDLADVVLPAATWGESTGTTTNQERRISRVRPAMDIPPGVRTDLDIITTVGRYVTPGLFGVTTPEPVFNELAALTAGTPADLSGISYDRLDRAVAVRWPAPDATSEGGYRYRTDDGWLFETQSGRAQFSTHYASEQAEPPNETYPLVLTTGRESNDYNTGVRSRDREIPNQPQARVHPETLASHAIEDLATLSSRRATVTVRVESDPAVPVDLVWLPVHHPRTNELTLPETDPRSDEPNYKQCAVRLAPAKSRPDSGCLEREN
jgi:assimilatory nitrate reductase catalytic subunit